MTDFCNVTYFQIYKQYKLPTLRTLCITGKLEWHETRLHQRRSTSPVSVLNPDIIKSDSSQTVNTDRPRAGRGNSTLYQSYESKHWRGQNVPFIAAKVASNCCTWTVLHLFSKVVSVAAREKSHNNHPVQELLMNSVLVFLIKWHDAIKWEIVPFLSIVTSIQQNSMLIMWIVLISPVFI